MKLAQIFGDWEASELVKWAPPNNRCLVDTHVNQQDLPYLTAIRPRSSKPHSKPLDALSHTWPFFEGLPRSALAWPAARGSRSCVVLLGLSTSCQSLWEVGDVSQMFSFARAKPMVT